MAENLQLGIKITADAAGAKASIASTAEEMQKLARASSYATRKATEEAKRMASAWADLGKSGGAQLSAIKAAERLSQGMSEAGQAAQKAARQAATGAGLMSQSFDNLSGSAKLAGTAIAGMVAAFSVRAVIDASREMDRLRGMMDAASGNAALSAQNLKFVDQTARALGINLVAAAEGFANITAAARGTALQGKAINDIFVAVAKASAAMGKSSSDTLSMIQALGQMISKGTVSMEELRGQLGDRLPGAFQLAAKAMGMTTKELDKLISSGQVSAVDFLPKLAQALEDAYGNARFDRLNNNIERLDSSWTKFKANAVDTEGMSKAIGGLVSVLDRLNVALEKSRNLGTQASHIIGGAYADPFAVIPGKAQVQKALAGQTGNNPLETIDASALNQTSGALNKTAQQYIAAASAAWKLNDAQKQVVETIVRIGDAKGFDPAFLLSIAKAETQLGNMKRLVSPTGAQGIFQFMPGTAKTYGLKDPWNVEQSTEAAIKYLSKLKGEFKSVGLAAAGYNAGEGAVRKYGNTVPPYKETQTYVKRVLQNYQQLQSAIGQGNEEISKELVKANNDQFHAYQDHLKARESATDASMKKQLAQQRTLMEQIDSDQTQAMRRANAAMAGGDPAAIKEAEAMQLRFYNDKKRLLLESIDLERKATRERIIDLGRMMQSAQENSPDKMPGLKQQRTAELAELAALAERRKQIEIGAASDIDRVRSEFEDKRRQADKQAADDYVASLEEQRKANEDAYQQMQQVMELRMTEAANLADARKQDIDNQVEAARTETAAAQAGRQASLEGLSGIEAQQKAREILNANLRDSLDLIDLEKTKALEKLVIDGDILASQRQLLEVYREIANQQGNRDQALAIEKQLQDIYAGQAKNIRDRVAAQSRAAAESAKVQVDAGKQATGLEDQSVKEEQLRMNAWWDQYMGRLRDYATLWEQITGNTSDGWSQMTLALGEYQKQFNQIQQYWQSDAGKSWGDLAPAMEIIQQAQAALAGMSKTLMALRNQYKEGSKGYEDMTNAAERMMEVQRVLAVVEGVIGVLHQLGSGDPYTAPARAAMAGAIVAAQLASIGMSAAATPGFSNRQAREASQTGGSTAAGGGVFGDTNAKSESISKSLEIVASNSNANLAYSAGMLRSLKNIELALAGTTNAIIRGVKPADVQGLGYKGLGMAVDPLGIGKLIGSGVYTKITNWGIKALPQQLDQIIAKGFQGMNWTEVTKSTKILGITISKSVKNIYGALDVGVAGQITRVIRSMADTVREAGKAFGVSGEQFMSAMKGFTVNFGTLATKGLKGDELEKAVQQVFSSMSDDMAQQFQSKFSLNLEPFMKAGEGMFQTLVRVADGINVATGMLEQAGIQAINYQQIVMKQGDVAAEIVRQSIVLFEGIGSAIGAYVDQAVGSAEELMKVYQDLLIVSDTAKLAGFNLSNLSNALIVTSGGVAKFLENLSTYQTEILGGSDYARQMLTLQREFGKLGKAVPANNEAFVRLVDSINTSTEAGQKLYAQILNLAGAFAKTQQEAAKLQELRDKYLPTDSLSGYKKQLAQVSIDFKQIIEGTLAGMPGGANYIKRTRRVEVLGNRIEDRTDQRDLIQAEIDALEAKSKLTAKEKQRLAVLRQERKALTDEIAGYQKQIDKINELIRKNPKSQKLIEERAKLMEEQGNAVIKVLGDIWDSMTQAINAAKETLISINDSIFELTAASKGPEIKAGMMTQQADRAGIAYNDYKGNDITQINKLANDYYKAIMDEYQAKLDLINAPKVALEKERDLRQKAHDEQIAALQKELDKAKELADAVNNINAYLKNLKLSASSTLSPKQQLDEAQRQYQTLLAKAQGGDVDAMRQITSASDAYLEAAKKYYGSGGAYGGIYDGIVSAMEKLGAIPTGNAEDIQQRIETLNEQHNAYLKSIDDQIEALNIDQQIKDLQAATVAKLQALADNLGPRITEAENKAREDMQKLIDEASAGNIWSEKQLEALNAMLKNWGMKPIEAPTTPAPGTTPGTTTPGTGNAGNPAKPGKPEKPAKPLNPADDPAKYDGPAAWKTWTDYWKQQQRIIKNHPEWNKTWAQFKVEEYQRLQAQGMHPVVPAFADGGFAKPGWALVGEEGPELVNFGVQAMVYDAEKTKKMLRGMASFQPVPSQGGKKINLETMPRVVNDIRSPSREPAKLYTDDVVAELRALQREVKALVTTQSGANPEIITELQTLNRRMDTIERQQRIRA